MVIASTCGPAGEPGLFLIDAAGIAPVTHPAASGHYSELKHARGALARLLAGPTAHATATRPAGRRGPPAYRPPCAVNRSSGLQAASRRSGSQPSQLPHAPRPTT